MEQDLFAHLPSEIFINILSRLPVRAIAFSKCVCKAWLDLLESDDFVNSHLSESSYVAALAVFMRAEADSNPCKVFELDDELDDLESHNPVTKFDFPRKATFRGFADDLIFLDNFDALYVCNPITREFIELHFRDEFVHSKHVREFDYGFGASKGSRQYKVVRLESKSDYCHVLHSWHRAVRRVEAATASASSLYGGSVFANGNLHWRVLDSNSDTLICCFDMETERFSTFSPPPIRRGGLINFELVNLRDCLCAVDNTTDDEIMIWLLKECGAEKSWRVGYMIDQHPDCDVWGFELVLPLQVFKNGDILLLCDEQFFCYSIKTKTYQEIHSFGASAILYRIPLLFTPSFRSLERNFGMENVMSF